jgi:hypothetical protein
VAAHEAEELFHRFAARPECEATEPSLALYVNGVGRREGVARRDSDVPLTRLSPLGVPDGSDGAAALEELAGSRIGVAEWAQTADTWARGEQGITPRLADRRRRLRRRSVHGDRMPYRIVKELLRRREIRICIDGSGLVA